ncbi:MAG: FkbM family methyltransferase [Rhodocyclaceae bacterium]|nr:FkbM family methyltransferase [Rhodocyclaceae bacterium]
MKLKSLSNRLLAATQSILPQRSYGQDGEDLILDRLLEGQAKGFYVDVGAHHPIRFSNTYLFYRRGWRGINIDAMPGAMRGFKRTRPRDINIERGVASSSGTLSYYRFNEPALNTFDPLEAARKNKPPYRILDQVDIEVERLDRLLERCLPAGQKIDFLSVDVEGKDLEVLESNNWAQFRPRFILAETLRTDIMRLRDCPIVRFLEGVGYTPVAKAYNTTFFASINWLEEPDV